MCACTQISSLTCPPLLLCGYTIIHYYSILLHIINIIQYYSILFNIIQYYSLSFTLFFTIITSICCAFSVEIGSLNRLFHGDSSDKNRRKAVLPPPREARKSWVIPLGTTSVNWCLAVTVTGGQVMFGTSMAPDCFFNDFLYTSKSMVVIIIFPIQWPFRRCTPSSDRPRMMRNRRCLEWFLILGHSSLGQWWGPFFLWPTVQKMGVSTNGGTPKMDGL